MNQTNLPNAHPMKTTSLTRSAAAVLALSGLAWLPCQAQTTRIPATPVGTLQAFPTVVQTGTKPTLTWAILYPSKISDMVEINPPGTITPNQTVYVTVQIVGTGIGTCETTPAPMSPAPPTDARVSLNGGAYQQLFYGTQTDVDPAKRLLVKKLQAGETLDFGGRYVTNNNWSPFYTTRSGNLQVVALVDGDLPPTSFSLYQQSFLASYLRPYLDASGRINIGPLSVLIMMELNQTNRSEKCFDYQDQVLLVTFSLKHPNNGHGNNLDGVDSSNPGQGVGGPTGLLNAGLDPSGGVDDEIR
jgi:hypothetical protein